MTPTEELKREHQAILLMLRILERICERLESRQSVCIEDLQRIVEFVQVFADRCHHSKEEDLLFVALEHAGIPRHGGPIEVMIHEHEEGRDYVRGLANAVAKYKAGDTNAAAQIVMNAREYIKLLCNHIDKEDNVLYPLADRFLDKDTQKKLLKDFEDVEHRRIGPGKHEEFHKLLETLKHRYLEDA